MSPRYQLLSESGKDADLTGRDFQVFERHTGQSACSSQDRHSKLNKPENSRYGQAVESEPSTC